MVKALLRTTMIAVGGVLGYVTMLNGTLAQNAYFIFFMALLVNGFFGLFSIYVCFERLSFPCPCRSCYSITLHLTHAQ